MTEDDIYSTIRGDCDGCLKKYCASRNHHELAWFLCRDPNKPKHPRNRDSQIVYKRDENGRKSRKSRRKYGTKN